MVDYHHVIAALRAQSGALANLAYRDALWPRSAHRRAWDALTADGPVRDAARTMVGLLALAHDRGVETDLAAAIALPADHEIKRVVLNAHDDLVYQRSNDLLARGRRRPLAIPGAFDVGPKS